MRVVGGSARGRRLVAPEGTSTRPTSDRVREAIMNALWSRDLLEGAQVLDLFAGSGALGIEALSRGAAHAVFVDDDARARRAVVENLAACGFSDQAVVVGDRAERFVASRAERRRQDGDASGALFDLVFCDPPYAFDGWEALLRDLPATVAVLESGAPVDLPEGWEMVRSSQYGTTWVAFAERIVETETGHGGEPRPEHGRGVGWT